jgi:O-antigen/teichoic acid export membrane protein
MSTPLRRDFADAQPSRVVPAITQAGGALRVLPANIRASGPEVSILASRGGLYLGIRYGLGILISCGNMFVLTRWIGPHAYGLFVTAVGLTSFLAALSRGGIDTYLVRAETPPDEHTYAVANTLILGFSIVLIGGGAAAVPLLTRWYGSREFLPAYLATLLTIPLAGLAGAPTAKLERELNFRAVAGIELGGQVLALLVSVALAWRGFGVWAPVAGLIVWQWWAAAGALRTAKLALQPAFDAAEARRMLSFGMGYSASLRIWQLRTLVNPLLVGRFAGAESVAYVALAIRTAEGLGFVRLAAGRLAIAALSRLRQDRIRFQSTLERALKLQVLALGPLLCLFALVAPAVVPQLLGSRWAVSLRIYPFVAAGVLVNSVYNLQASALFVTGQPGIVLRAYTLHVALLGLGTWMLLPSLGILGYGCAEIAACGGYAVLHAGTRGIAQVSYRRLGWLAAAFLMPPFALLVRGGWGASLWIPMFVLASLEAWNRGSRGKTRPEVADADRAIPSVSPMRSKFSDTGA